MKKINIWQLPASPIGIGDVIMYHDGVNVLLLYDFTDDKNDNRDYHGALIFKRVIAHLHASENYSEYVPASADTLVEITNSEWVDKLKKLDSTRSDVWKMKHYAIFIKDYGLYEFAASEFIASPIKAGKLDEKYIWTIPN